MEKEKWMFTFPTANSKTLMECFTSFFNAYPDAKNIEVVNFSQSHMIISWDK